MKNTHPLYIAFEVLKAHLIIICEMQSLDLLFLVVLCQILYLQSPHLPPLLNIQSPLSVTKVFCQCLLRLKKNFILWHEMIEFNEFSVLLLELNSPNYSLAIGSKNQYYFTQMHNPNIKIYQFVTIYITLFFCLHQSDLLN